ncbi:MAG: DUF3168 domain-containing protein [Pseudomonadota bacterium]
MSYALSEPLQVAVYNRLLSSPAVTSIVGTAIYDTPPPGEPYTLPPTHVTLGEERARPASSATHKAAFHDFNVTVHTDHEGFSEAKLAAAEICLALDDAPLALSRGHLVSLRFLSARAERNTARRPRRVVLRFRAHLEDAA